MISIEDNVKHSVNRFDVVHVVNSTDKVFVEKVTKEKLVAVVDVGDNDVTGIEWEYTDGDLSLVENGDEKESMSFERV